jgi:hypothetical protein
VSWLAYVDESIRTDDGVYVLAAVALHAADADGVRDAVRSLEPRPGRRFHWRDKEPFERRDAVEMLARLPILPIVVVGAPVNARRQERARRGCLERLLYELAAAGWTRCAWSPATLSPTVATSTSSEASGSAA